MFQSLQERLGGIFGKLTRRGALTEAEVTAALREVRIALLEADVALPVVKDFVAAVRERAVGQEVLRSVTPGQQVVKIVNDCLVETLGSTSVGIDLNAAAPVAVMLVGLQGSGKTTSCAKIARLLRDKERKKVLMASLDTRRPAAQRQLAVLGEEVQVATLPIVEGQDPVAIARRARTAAAREGFDVLLLDTAGRLAIDGESMAEAAAVRDAADPHESLLVADAMTGQDAVTVAAAFKDKVGLTGIVLTRVDGDARGGAALSLRAVTGCPIKLIGVGEKMDRLEGFHPDRIAGRILGMGDVVSLVERAAETIEQAEAEKLAAKLQKGRFDLNDLAGQLRQLQKMGGLSSMMGMLPGLGKIKSRMQNTKVDDAAIGRQLAIISSMTPKERLHPEIVKASRKQRIAKGCGLAVNDVNKLLKQHQEAGRVIKQMKKMGKKGFLGNGIEGLMGKGTVGGGAALPGGFGGGPFGPGGGPPSRK
ncbi:MAG: signal recognition particle protein [Rhodospirillales bacterium]|nr:signal recognition particle protein [Rhodospirillales bacterium]